MGRSALPSEGGGITANSPRPQGPWAKKAAGFRLPSPAPPPNPGPDPSGFLVGGDVAVDKVRDVVVVLLFLFQERIIRRVGLGLLLDFDVVDHRFGGLLLARLDLIERHESTPAGVCASSVSSSSGFAAARTRAAP